MKIAVILAGSALVCSALPARAGVDAFRDGQADRASYEAWFGALSGDMRSGAEYWAGQRSLKNPGSCYSASGQPIAGGCKAGQQQLAPDARRKSEPEYRAGWNSLPASTQPGATEPSSHAQMANADCSTAASSTGYYSPASALQVIRDCEYRRDEARRAIESERFAGEMRARQAAEDVARVERDDRDRRERVRAAEVARLREAAFETEAAQAAADKIREQEREKAKLVAAETSPDNNCRKPNGRYDAGDRRPHSRRGHVA